MCGRFSLAVKKGDLVIRFNVDAVDLIRPRYNCAPSQKLAVISNADPSTLDFYRWGLIPSWARDTTISSKTINAKAETIAEKPSFRQAFRKQRCLVPADSFYEWQRDFQKTPYRIMMKDESPFAMAGIWDVWFDGKGEEIRSFSVITTIANELVAPIHHRMPVILPRGTEQQWLEGGSTDSMMELLKPYPSEEMKAYKISDLVNRPANDSADIWKAV